MAVIRAGYAVAIKNDTKYDLGTLRSVSLSPNFVQLSRLGGGEGQIEDVSISFELESIPAATEAEIINQHCGYAWAELETNNADGMRYKVTQVYDAVLTPIAKSAVAKGSGNTTVTTLSLNGTAYLNYYDEYKTESYFSTQAEATAFIDSLVGGDED